MLGTTLAKRFQEAMTDQQYRVWAGRLITAVGGYPRRDAVGDGAGLTIEEVATVEREALVLDLVEWLAPGSRPYTEVLEAWRTSCPRLTVWEDALDRGYLRRDAGPRGTMVAITPLGQKFLCDHGRAPLQPIRLPYGSMQIS